MRQKVCMCMSQRRHGQVLRHVRVTPPIPTAAQRELFYHVRDMLLVIAQDESYPGPWRSSCFEGWQVLTKDGRTVA